MKGIDWPSLFVGASPLLVGIILKFLVTTQVDN